MSNEDQVQPCGETEDQPVTEAPKGTPLDDEGERKLSELRRLGGLFRSYPSGPNRRKHVEEITALLEVRDPERNTVEHLAKWEELGPRVVNDANMEVGCGQQYTEYRRARQILKMPTTARQVVIGIVVDQLELPAGQEYPDPKEYIVTISTRDGQKVLAAHTTATVASSYESRRTGRDVFRNA